ncbi:MAG: signal peptidase I [Planctomycetes bacterium]|nr:signal peptidase I [Planctomycetota bacterium]
MDNIAKNKRRIWVAIMFSLIMEGLGQIYCGRLKRGLVFTLLNLLPIPIIIGIFYLGDSPALMPITIAVIISSGLVQVIALVDAVILAKKAPANYQLKSCNSAAIYILLVLITTAGAIGSGLYLRDKSLEAFKVSAASMFPTIELNERVLANKHIYAETDPQVGDIVIFNPPNEHWRINYIKRVVAVAGDTVERKNDVLFINGKQLQRRHASFTTLEIPEGEFKGSIYHEENGQSRYQIFVADRETEQQLSAPDFALLTVPEHHVFVLGDNRNLSSDSRTFGPIPLAAVNGRADYIYFPVNDWSRFGKLK